MSMQALHSLVHSMSRSELKVVRTSLVCFASYKTDEVKTVKLFEYLLSSKSIVPTTKECCLAVYGTERDKRFKMLKSRLKAKLLDSISLDFNIDRRELFDPRDKQTIKIRKKLSQLFFVFFSKGDSAMLKSLLSEIIQISKVYENYASLAEALKFKKYSKGFCKGEEEFNEVNKEIEFYEHCNRCLDKASDAYYRSILRTDFHVSTDQKQFQHNLKENIDELKKDQEDTKSSLIAYYRQLLEIAYYENNEDYENAHSSCIRLLDIVTKNKAVYRKQRVGVVLANLCQLNIYIGNYEDAVKNIREALLNFSPDYVNYSMFREQEFYALFYSGKMDTAQQVLNELLKKANIDRGDFRLARYRFYKANMLFRQRQFKETLSELSMHFEISKDKSGWEIAIRILTIMALIEMERFDEASVKISGLHKHMERNADDTKMLQREDLILKVLEHIERKGFSFEHPSERLMKYITSLESNQPEYKWRPLKAELIPFHTWIKGKLKKLPSKKKEKVAEAD